MKRLALEVVPGEYTVTRLEAGSPAPTELFELVGTTGLVSITSTPQEISIVCPTDLAPFGDHEHGWRLLTVRGPLEFTLTGIMAALAGELAAAGVSLFALSTYNTDHVLVKAVDLGRAIKALTEAGHEVHEAA
jgi:uncharacterized protein